MLNSKQLFFNLVFYVALLFLFDSCQKKESSTTTTVTTVPIPPTDLTATVFSTTQVNLSWVDKSTNEVGFKLERKTSTTQYTTVASLGADITSYNDNGLSPNTSYTYRVYSYNSVGASLTYSNEVTITTIGLPSITTTSVSNLTALNGSSGGNITSDGGGAITSRGVVWSISQNPTVALSTKTTNGTGIGLFTSTMADLTPSTKYYVRAYATNIAGTAYGNEVTFTTGNLDLKNGLIAYYPFTGNAGDSSGNNNHGNVIGASLTTDRFGDQNKAYSFNGSSNVIKVLRNAVQEPQNEISISCWIYPVYLANQGSDITSDATQILRKGAGFNTGYHLSWSNLRNNKLESHYYGSWGNVVHGVSNEPYKNKWQNVVMTYSINAGISRLYVNGIQISSANCSKKLEHSDDLYIGGFNTYQYFTGKIDDVRIYNRTLNQDEITYISKN
jgi:hypothetical protein